MFRCDHCHTEYGGIRGIAADRCPRCTSREGGAAQRAPAPVPLALGDWRPAQLATASWSMPAPPPLTGPIAQLDRAVRF